MKRIISLLIAAILMFGLLAGCQTEEGLPPTPEKALEIKQAYIRRTGADDYTVDDLTLRSVWCEDSIYAVYVDGPFGYTQAVRDVVIGEYGNMFLFTFQDGQRLYIYKDNSIYTLEEAYAADVLKTEHLESLQKDDVYKNVPIPSSDPEETTEPIPSSDPEETTEPPKLGDIGSSTLAPEHLFPFIYDGSNPSAWWVADTEQCVIGGLYVAHKGETGKTVQIADEEILLYASCEDHILYVTKAEPRKVVQTDYSGQSHTVIYEAVHGDIVCLEYYDKVGQKGQLVTLEGNSHVVLIDIASSEAEVLMVQENIIAVSLDLYGRQGLIWFRKADYSPWFYNTQTGELMEDTSL